MQVKVYAVNQETGERTEAQISDTLDMFPDDEQSRISVEDEIRFSGRSWIGGGAAQLFYAVKA